MLFLLKDSGIHALETRQTPVVEHQEIVYLTPCRIWLKVSIACYRESKTGEPCGVDMSVMKENRERFGSWLEMIIQVLIYMFQEGEL